MNFHAKQQLVLVPGPLCDAQAWWDQIAGRAQYRRLPGRRPHALGFDGRDRADILHEIVYERFALAGLSMGGYVALEIFRQAGRASHPTGAARYDRAGQAG
jgi:pimeloyl-ACP methyl ester carboxylesterase